MPGVTSIFVKEERVHEESETELWGTERREKGTDTKTQKQRDRDRENGKERQRRKGDHF